MEPLEQFSASWLMPEEAWMVEIELFHDRVPNRAAYLFLKIQKKVPGIFGRMMRVAIFSYKRSRDGRLPRAEAGALKLL
jgi:hypothetical protein